MVLGKIKICIVILNAYTDHLFATVQVCSRNKVESDNFLRHQLTHLGLLSVPGRIILNDCRNDLGEFR